MNRLLLAALVLAAAGAPRYGTATPQTCVWTGQGGNALWSTDGNWTCIGLSPHGHPQNGDDIGFADNSQQPVNTNDLSQLVVHHLILDRHALLVTGNPIYEVIEHYRMQIEASQILETLVLSAKKYQQ